MKQRLRTIALAVVTGVLIILLLSGCMCMGKMGDKDKAETNHTDHQSSATQP